jgi:hypothetical protein
VPQAEAAIAQTAAVEQAVFRSEKQAMLRQGVVVQRVCRTAASEACDRVRADGVRSPRSSTHTRPHMSI